MALTPGARLAQYEIVAPLGSGGMGEVYRARDLRLHRDVAIKVMAERIAADPEMRQRFETEARAVAALSHPGIMSIHELAVVDGLPVAVMELLEGETLRRRMKNGPTAWRDAVEIIAAAADGLAAAHTKGIIHRDLKPENIFITREGVVKVLDFGLALHRLSVPAVTMTAAGASLTAEGIVLGTFGYMSPEQVRGERVDGRSDVFALGCVLYELLTGRQLFSGATPQEVVANLMHDSIPDMSAIDPYAPQELRAIVSRSVERDRNRRFESASAVAMALRALLTGSASKAAGKRPRARGKSLAVLPFVNGSADPQIDYITDGITESIINSLSQLGGLRVVPRSLAFRYKGLQADPATVGLALNARTILPGRVVRQDDVLHIQAELVDTANESQLWGDRFHRQMTDLITVQEEIAWQISEALRLKLTGAQKSRLRKRATVHPEAYQEYLRGRFHWNAWGPDSFTRAREHFERAIALDPGYAEAFAGLGDAYGAMAYYGAIAPEEGFPRSRAAAVRALELNPDLADAHVTLAIERLFWGWDWDAAGLELKLAHKLNPRVAGVHSVSALYFATCGRYEDALREAREGRELDPLSVFATMAVAWATHFAGLYEESIREARKALDLAPALAEAVNIIAAGYEAMGRYEEAARFAGGRPGSMQIRANTDALVAAFRANGPEGYWRGMLAACGDNEQSPQLCYVESVILARLGETERALDQLEYLLSVHSPGMVFLAADPCYRSLHGHPRYEALVTKLGVPRPHKASAPRKA